MRIEEILQKLKTALGINEMANINACGYELSEETTSIICEKYKLGVIKQSDPLDKKISWLIKYVDTVPKNELVGLKISNMASVKYLTDDKWIENSVTLCVGDTEPDSNVLKANINQGLIHMKYGDNKHWDLSKQALHILPTAFKNGRIIQAKEPFKYEIIYKKHQYIYVVGVPSPMGDATILITCQKRNK